MNDRYSRQRLFQPIGESGQHALENKHEFIVGAGALGSANAEALVRSGVGQVTIVDRDYVEWSNLQRQQLYTEEDVEKQLPKSIAAKNRLTKINSLVKINGIVNEEYANEETILNSGDVVAFIPAVSGG